MSPIPYISESVDSVSANTSGSKVSAVCLDTANIQKQTKNISRDSAMIFRKELMDLKKLKEQKIFIDHQAYYTYRDFGMMTFLKFTLIWLNSAEKVNASHHITSILLHNNE